VGARQLAGQQANMATLRVVAGVPYMHDPKLLRRLDRIQIPTLVIWSDSDRIATPAYGHAYAAALSNARFEVITNAGHLPQLEQPDATFALIDQYFTTKGGTA
jgi:pimeloyl-ACP methyl ester carboxylesterase